MMWIGIQKIHQRMNAPGMIIRKKSRDYIILDNKRIEVAWFGPSPREAPTIVFLHEGLGCVSMWRDFPEKLSAATGCGALVYSRLGYGGSDPCRLPRSIRFMFHEGLVVLPRLLEAAGIGESIIIGHSDGGSIAIIYAGGGVASGLRGLITEAAHVFCERVTLDSIRKAMQAYVNGDLREKLEKYHGRNVGCAFWGWNDTWLHPDFVYWNIERYLPQIIVPTLIIQGQEDEYGTPLQADAIYQQAGGESELLMLPNCGHAPHIQQEMPTLEAMTRFILDVV